MNENSKDWLQKLKVGDKVVVYSPSTFGSTDRVATVTAVNRRWVSVGQSGNFKLTTGRQIRARGSSGYWLPSLEQATPERLKQIRDAHRKQHLISRIVDGAEMRVVEKAPLENLEKLHAEMVRLGFLSEEEEG